MIEEIGRRQIRLFLGHIFLDESGKTNVIANREINDQEADDIRIKIRVIERFFRSQNIINSVIANRNEVGKAIVQMGSTYLGDNKLAEDAMDHASFDISRQMANTCSIFRFFIDHFDRYFIKQYGKLSDMHNQWKKEMAIQYEQFIEYRIFYHMRNYIQHYDLPPISLQISTDKVEGVEVRVDLNISALMEDNTFKSKIGPYSGPENIPLLNLIDAWSKCLDQIFNFVNSAYVRQIRQDAADLIEVRALVTKLFTGRIAIVSIPETGNLIDRLQMKFEWIPEQKCNAIMELK